MKKIISFLICFTIFFSTFSFIAFADTGGSGNLDGGGGGLGQGSSENFWNGGDDGVRVTVVTADTGSLVATPVDLTNKRPNDIAYHFGKVSKVQYRSGTSLTVLTSQYGYKNPVQTLPRIVSADGNVNIDAIKAYFCSEYAVKLIAELTGIDYDTLINGSFKLLLEQK